MPKTVLIVEAPDGGHIEHPLPLPAGLDPLRWLAAAAKHLPLLRDCTAYVTEIETRAEREARHRGAQTDPSTTATSSTRIPIAAG